MRISPKLYYVLNLWRHFERLLLSWSNSQPAMVCDLSLFTAQRKPGIDLWLKAEKWQQINGSINLQIWRNMSLGVLHRQHQWWGKLILRFWKGRRSGGRKEKSHQKYLRTGKRHGKTLRMRIMEIRTNLGSESVSFAFYIKGGSGVMKLIELLKFRNIC